LITYINSNNSLTHFLTFHDFQKDVQLIVCSLGIHHHSKHWDDPEVYNPDRFLEPNNSNIERHAFTPFGGGVRICPGRQLAMTELRILTAKIFHKYDPELAEPDAEPKYRFEAVNYCYELMLRFKPRKIAQ
jgi:cytochrome P450